MKKHLWGDIPKNNHSVALREAHYKTLLDWYLYPTKLKRIFPDTSDLCWRGCGLQGDFRHILWDCPGIQPFWEEILSHIKGMLGYPVPTTIEGALLGIRDPDLQHQTKADKAILWTCLGMAKLTIAFA